MSGDDPPGDAGDEERTAERPAGEPPATGEDPTAEEAAREQPGSDGGPAGGEESDAPPGESGWTPAWLADLRADDHRRHAALVAAAMVGVAAAAVHWLGLFLAGALVGLVSRTLPRAVAAGLGVGLLVLAVHVGASPTMGAGEFLALAPASYVTLGAGLVAPVWGALVRGVL